MLNASIPAILAQLDRLDLRYLLLTLILCVMLGGLFPTLVDRFGQPAVYTTWLLLWALLASFWMELPLHRLLRPAAPLVAWVIFYAGWGVMAADYPIFEQGYRLVLRFLTITAAMAVVTSRPGRLRLFANAVQWVLVVNLVVTVVLMTRPEYQGLGALGDLNIDTEADRFSGMWGNANQAGLVALMVLVLSYWASRWTAWIGRISGLAIIYLTASRTASWILVALALLYLVFAATRRVRKNALALGLVLALGAFFALKGTGASLETLVAGSPTLARVTDLGEARTVEAGGRSRRQVLGEWLRLVPAEPWYGYGLYTLYGGGESPEVVSRPALPTYGPHNLYLGIFLDVGAVGLVTFLGLILLQLRAIKRTPLVPGARHTLFGFCILVLVFSNFNHNLLADYAGWMAYSLIFLLPAAPALAGQRFLQDGLGDLERS